MASPAIIKQKSNNNPISDPMEDNQFGEEEEFIKVPIVSTEEVGNGGQKRQDNSQEGQKQGRQPVNKVNGVESRNQGRKGVSPVDQLKPKQLVAVEKSKDIAKEKATSYRRKQISQSKTQKLSNQFSKEKLNVSVFNPQTWNEERKLINTKDLEAKIKEIAKQIRSKVKKDEPKYKRMRATEPNNEKKLRRNDIVLTPLRNSVVVDQFSLTSPQMSEFDSSKVQEESKVSGEIDVIPKTIVKTILRKEVFDKVDKHIQKKELANRIKLKLDPIKHHYPITSFRKSVLQEDKNQYLKGVEKEKEKQIKLAKRKEAFNNSRYQRYAKIITKKSKVIDRSSFKKEPEIIETNQDHNTSNLFSIDLTLENPSMDPEPFLTQNIQNKPAREDVVKPTRKMEVVQSIQEIDNLIKNMIQSNESFPKESNLYEPSEEEKIQERPKEQEEGSEKEEKEGSEKEEKQGLEKEGKESSYQDEKEEGDEEQDDDAGDEDGSASQL